MIHRAILIVAVSLAVVSCATQRFDVTLIYGHTKDVTEADVRATLSARTSLREMPVYEIEVVSRDEIRLYLMPRGQGGDICDEVVRSRGKWRDNNGKETKRRQVWTDTWLKRSGKWQIVAAQDTIVHCDLINR